MTMPGLEEFPAPPDLDLPKADRLMSLLRKVESIGVPWSQFATALMTEGRLPPSRRELVILRVASRRGCPYALAAHRLIGRHCGLSEARIVRALDNDRQEFSDPVDAGLMVATDELIDLGRLSDATKEALQEFLDEAALIELTMLVGQYVLVAMLCETFQLRPEPALARQITALS